MKTKTTLFALQITFISLIAKANTAETIPKNDSLLFHPVVQKIEKMISGGELPSMAVAVLKNGEVRLKKAFGHADLKAKVPATSSTQYTVGSLSKSITATGIMVLVQQGRIDLDKPVNSYLTQQKLNIHEGSDASVTVKHLLNCTAGIPHGWEIKNQLLDNHTNKEENYVRDFGMAVFPAGETYLYSNHAYGIAAKLIEKVSGKRYEAFMKEEVFGPLYMENSFASFGNAPSVNRAVLYEGDSSQLPDGTYTAPFAGAGLYASLDDMIKYGTMHLGHPDEKGKNLLSKKSLNLMHYTKGHNNPNWFMTLGWHELKLDENTSALVSNGEVLGGNATLILVPKQDLMVVALANKSFSPSVSDQITFQLVEIMYPGFMEKLGGMIAKYESEVFRAYEPTPELSGVWEGDITNANTTKQVEIHFQKEGDIIIKIDGQKKTVLKNPSYEHGTLKGECYGYLSESDAQKPKNLQFFLRTKNGRMYGYVGYSYEKVTPWASEITKTGVETAYISLNKK